MGKRTTGIEQDVRDIYAEICNAQADVGIVAGPRFESSLELVMALIRKLQTPKETPK